MEQATNNYTEENSNESQTWDLSVRSHANLEANINLNTTEPLILDLSCKKRVPMLTKELASSISLASSLVGQQYQQPGLPDTAHSPIAGIPSASEPDLPKNTKYEPIHNNNQINNNLPVISSSTAMMSHEQSLLQPRADIVHMPVMETITTFPVTAPNMPMPYVDVPSFNEAIRTISPTALQMLQSSRKTESLSPSPSPGAIRKTQRPFKAYPKNPFYFLNPLDYMQEHEKYGEFREKMLMNMKNTVSSNPKMRRVSKNSASPTSTVTEKDAAYFEKRKKNNEAAKRSRDNRKAKEDELAIRVVYLEQENIRLKNKIKLMYLAEHNRNQQLKLHTSNNETFYWDK